MWGKSWFLAPGKGRDEHARGFGPETNAKYTASGGNWWYIAPVAGKAE
jgi:hypothetical protein